MIDIVNKIAVSNVYRADGVPLPQTRSTPNW